jgi:hypothetical protein
MSEIGSGKDEIADAAVSKIEACRHAPDEQFEIGQDDVAQVRSHARQQGMRTTGIIVEFGPRLVIAQCVRKSGVADLDHVAGPALAMRHGHQRLAYVAHR